MENLNKALFLWINASAYSSPKEITIAIGIAEYLIFIIPIGLLVLWLLGRKCRLNAVHCLLGLLLALAINKMISLFWIEARPFILGVGTHWLPHKSTPAFPSNHGTLMFSSAFLLLNTAERFSRILGWLSILCALPVAWARIYLGVHWPIDMLGALTVAVVVALIMRTTITGEISHITCVILERIYRKILAGPITRGWLRP
ncbi:phosphatase PAP2 family protein [Candidatus Pandoraea novymonadis]|uniref:Undecaprenyl-diphosphatase YbjG n=1 Tax=Candidatus Pandoraea novymonadis TaxID=1808959 RepID=A0ABX5FG84_9BURK|nr:phosphatase PAP2 family protein [Candidatus Pandoraea novymonadis]PSB92137.1 putative undecaprenyl-diphosphatase YbjG [Candidatus Pandoraea novymonadis]